MKTFITKKLILGLLVFGGLISTAKAQSAYDDQQYSYNDQSNGYAQPQVAPTDQQSFYYYPDANVYYDINCNRYLYNNGGSWLSVNVLPSNIYIGNMPRYTVYHRGGDVWRDNAFHVRNFDRPAYNRQPIVAYNNYRHDDFGHRNFDNRGFNRGSEHRDFGRGGDNGRGNNDRGNNDRGHDDHGRGNRRW